MDPENRQAQATGIIAVLLLWLLDAGWTLLVTLPRLAAHAGRLIAPESLLFARPTIVDGYLNALGPSGRQLYRHIQWNGLIGAVYLAFAGIVILRWLARKLPADARWPRWLVLLPLVTGLVDAGENLLLLRAVDRFPALSPSLIPFLTSAKLVLMVLLLLSIAALAAIALRLVRLAPVTP